MLSSFIHHVPPPHKSAANCTPQITRQLTRLKRIQTSHPRSCLDLEMSALERIPTTTKLVTHTSQVLPD